jgi:hypothetical protein
MTIDCRTSKALSFQLPEVRLMQDAAHLFRSSAGVRLCRTVMYFMFFDGINIPLFLVLVGDVSWALQIQTTSLS